MAFLWVLCGMVSGVVQQKLSGSPYPTGCDCVYYGGNASAMVHHKAGAGVGKESTIGRGSCRDYFCHRFVADDLCFL